MLKKPATSSTTIPAKQAIVAVMVSICFLPPDHLRCDSARVQAGWPPYRRVTTWSQRSQVIRRKGKGMRRTACRAPRPAWAAGRRRRTASGIVGRTSSVAPEQCYLIARCGGGGPMQRITTVYWRADLLPDLIGVRVGLFDDQHFLSLRAPSSKRTVSPGSHSNTRSSDFKARGRNSR